MEPCRSRLISGLKSLKIKLSEEQIRRCLDFLELIEKWSKAYNLTAIRQVEDMVAMHLLDSLAVLPYIQGGRVADVGTGAGLPGIPLAIAQPDVNFTLLDSNAKKTRFVQQAVIELKLKNVNVYLGRVQLYHPKTGFDTVIARAYAALPDIVATCGHLLAADGILLAMKGQAPDAERAELKAASTLIPLAVPGIEGERCLIKLQSQAITGD